MRHETSLGQSLEDPNDTPDCQDFVGKCAEFEADFEDKVDAINDIYLTLKGVAEEDLSPVIIDQMLHFLLIAARNLDQLMRDEWFGDDAHGGLHHPIQGDNYEVLKSIIEAEKEQA